jgi:hypothetical protein
LAIKNTKRGKDDQNFGCNKKKICEGGPCNGYLDYLDVSFQSLNHISIKHSHEFNSQFWYYILSNICGFFGSLIKIMR